MSDTVSKIFQNLVYKDDWELIMIFDVKFGHFKLFN